MKKIFSIFLAFSILYLVFSSTVASAQDVASESAKNNYQLPYAGLLPDNPLYAVKALRDRIIEFLISDPIKKAEFDLLSADKRLSIGMALFEKKKFDLAESTISKGENYSGEGIKNLDQAKKEGRQIDPSLLVAYESSTKKHKEILEGLIARSSGETKKKLGKTLERVEKFILMVDKLKL